MPRKAMEEAELLQLYEISYSDLMLLSSSSSSSSCSDEESAIMENLGPTGPGLLAVTGVPNASLLRRKLLPLARKLALLNPDHRKLVLKEHNLGSDVPLKNPDRNVSSFAMQLRYTQGLESTQTIPSGRVDQNSMSQQNGLCADTMNEFLDDEFENLGTTFKELGFCMMKLGICLARICDRAIGGNELEQSLLESCAAKGRLIHYHSKVDSFVLKEAGRKKGSNKMQANNGRSEQKPPKASNMGKRDNSFGISGLHSNLWQQWHYDYGIFTVLTDPMFLLTSTSPVAASDDGFSVSNVPECPSLCGHSYLQIYDPNKNKVLMVKISPESLIVQVGESADILSKGKLRSTLHCVRRPEKSETLSRETFAVFLQPAWSKTFSVLDYHMDHLGCQHLWDSEKKDLANEDLNALRVEIQKIVPPLPARLKDGMTFAEFSRETTKQYYGGSGLQSNR